MCSVPLSIKPQREQDPNGRWRSASMMEEQPSVGVGGPWWGGEAEREPLLTWLTSRPRDQLCDPGKLPDPSVKKQDAYGARNAFLECSESSELICVVSRTALSSGKSSRCIHAAVAMGTCRPHVAKSGPLQGKPGVLTWPLSIFEGWPLLQKKTLKHAVGMGRWGGSAGQAPAS